MALTNMLILIGGLLAISVFNLLLPFWEPGKGKELLIRFFIIYPALAAYFLNKASIEDIFLGIILIPLVDMLIRQAGWINKNSEKRRLARKERKDYAFNSEDEQSEPED